MYTNTYMSIYIDIHTYAYESIFDIERAFAVHCNSIMDFTTTQINRYVFYV